MSDYLPHTRAGGMKDAQGVLDYMLAGVMDKFDSVACCGLSGDPAVVWAYRHDKRVIRVRPPYAMKGSHGDWVEGWSPKVGYVLIDDFASSGKTIQHVLDMLDADGYEYPEYVLLYNTSREYNTAWLPSGRGVKVNSITTFHKRGKLIKFKYVYSPKEAAL